MDQLPILIAGGDEGSRDSLCAILRRRGYAVTLSGDYPSLAAAFEQAHELALVTLPAPGTTGLELLRDIKGVPTAPPVIVVGRDATIPGAAEAFEQGARDYVPMIGDGVRLYESLGLALGTSRRDSQLRYLRSRAAQEADWDMLAGECEAMRRTVAMVKQILKRTAVRSAPPILITGETGTGKGLLARCIHYNSVRRNEPFVDVNCAAIPPSLIEAELFGHERGAFTDARTARPGLFETAHRGSLFLDEVASLPPDMQAKLLTVAEEQRVRRIGSRSSRQVDVQIIAATHRNLPEMVASGDFREDLFYRLNVLAAEMPPLRDRGDDKLLLAERFVAQMAAGYSLGKIKLSQDAKDAIVTYHWPGNVRELKNQLERITLLLDGDLITRDQFVFASRAPSVRVTDHAEDIAVSLPPDGLSLDQLERAVLRKALQMCDYNVSRAARFLDISRQTLIYRLRKHAISSDPDEG